MSPNITTMENTMKDKLWMIACFVVYGGIGLLLAWRG